MRCIEVPSQAGATGGLREGHWGTAQGGHRVWEAQPGHGAVETARYRPRH